MLRRAWKPLATTFVLAGPPTVYWWYSKNSQTPETFNITVREMSPDGHPVKVSRSFPLLTKEAVDKRIRELAIAESIHVHNGRHWKFATAQLPSNNPIEDTYAHGLFPKSVPGFDQRMYFAVMDGHSGFHTSRLLSRVLIPSVALELSNTFSQSSFAQHILKYVNSVIPLERLNHTHKEPTTGEICRAIRTAFTNLDHEIITTPLKLLAANTDKGELSKGLIPDLSKNPMALAAMRPALSGSCAIMAILDPTSEDLYVACTGDARAVAGYWENSSSGIGRWRVEVLSEDQTGRNPDELKRIQSEHPVSETNDVIKNGRILGALEPSRAFGDARYKWAAPVQDALNKAFLVGNGMPMRPAPPLLKTPPYVTATPVVTHRTMSLPESNDGDLNWKSSLRFVVLATDGLWDRLSSKEVVSLVGGYLAGIKGNLSKDTLTELVPIVDGTHGVEGKGQRRENRGSWAFVDENVSAHLIRNAFGGGDDHKLRRLVSIPAPHSRRYRDDVTVTVIWWETPTAINKTKAKL